MSMGAQNEEWYQNRPRKITCSFWNLARLLQNVELHNQCQAIIFTSDIIPQDRQVTWKYKYAEDTQLHDQSVATKVWTSLNIKGVANIQC